MKYADIKKIKIGHTDYYIIVDVEYKKMKKVFLFCGLRIIKMTIGMLEIVLF